VRRSAGPSQTVNALLFTQSFFSNSDSAKNGQSFRWRKTRDTGSALNRADFAAKVPRSCVYRPAGCAADDSSAGICETTRTGGTRHVNALTLQESPPQPELAAAVPLGLMDHAGVLEAECPTFGRTATDELLNTATHGFGFLLAVVGTRSMVRSLLNQVDAWLVAGCGMYLFSLLSVYAMSTLSHAATSAKWKTLFRQLDQGFIYLLIVATYTPYSLVYLHGPFWFVLLCGMWAGALVGFTMKVFFAHRVDAVSVAAPLLLGWVPIVSVPTLLRTAPVGAYDLIIGGGIFYTVGILFLINDERVKHFHAVWHLCVIAGSTCHFLGLLNYVLAG
jgi:hemolysin III